MQTRVAKQVARMKREITLFQPLQAYVSPRPGGKTALLTGIAAGLYRALDRPGVAPTTKPKSASGGETFHFSLTAVTKTSPFTRALTGEREGAAAAHESYIEREDAPEEFEQAQNRFLETAGRLSGRTLPKDVDLALQGQEYIERKNAVEAAPTDAAALSMYGNLPDSYEQRLAYWEAVEAHEREPRTHNLSIDPTQNPEVWARIAQDPQAPREILAAAELPRKTITYGKGENEKTREALGELKLTEARALAVHEYLKPIKGASKLYNWTPGRGGRVQMRLIISLPYELSADDRFQLLKSFCDSQFRNLKADDGTSTDVPFWAVVHKPEATSDDRNYHAHIVFSERPAGQIKNPNTGEHVWDFAYKEEYRDKKRTLRFRYPAEQEKLRLFNDRRWPERARITYANLANDLLKSRRIEKRLDPRSYKEMGLKIEPIQRMKPNEYAKEKKGQNSVSGAKTIDAQWDRITASLDQRFPLKSFFPPHAQALRFDSELRRWKTFDHPAHYMLLTARRRWKEAWLTSRVLDANAAAAAVAIERMRSKYDAPGKSRLHDHPEIAEFFTAMADKYVAAPRIEAANQRLTQQQMLEYLNALSSARGPQIGDPISQMVHSIVPSVHPSKIKNLDTLIGLTTGYMQLASSGVSIGMADFAVPFFKQQQETASESQQPVSLAAPEYVTAPTPARPYRPVPPGVKTPFKSNAGRLLGRTDELIFRIRRITREQEDKLRHYEWQKQDDEARLARIAAMEADKTPRVTTSSLIDNRPYSPPAPQKAPVPTPPAVRHPAQTASHTRPAASPATPSQSPAPTQKPIIAPPAPARAAPEPTTVTAAPSPSSGTEPTKRPISARKSPTGASPPEALATPAPAQAPIAAVRPSTTPEIPGGQPKPALSPSPSMPDQPRSSAPQKAEHPEAPAPRQEPPPEPPRATKEQLDALERRKKRRRAMFFAPGKDLSRTR